MLAETGTTSVPKSVWLVIVVLMAYVLSLWPIQQFLRKDNYCGKERHPINTIEAFAARFVILYSFIVYYLIAFIEATDQHLIPTAFVLYLGVDRLISMFNIIKEYEQKAYNSLFRDAARWIRKRRGMDIAQVQPE